MASLSEANQILGQLIVDIQSTHAEDITTLLEDKKRLEAKLQGWKRDANKYEAALHAMLPSNQTFNDPLDQQSNEDFDQAFECEIMLDYQKIKMAIEGWVHDAVADSEDNALYEYFKQQRNGVETTQGSRMQRFLYENELEKMGPHRYSNHFILTVLIHYGLSHSLRFKHYPIGISHAQAQFMLGIEMGISYLHSPRGM